MTTIIGVRFRVAGKIYYFDPGDKEIARGSRVIVETARGMEMGTVMVGNKQVEDEAVVQPLKPVIRLATEEDLQIAEKNKEKEKEAFRICQEKIKKHELEMKLVDVEYTFDNNKILFYFTADGRIDFRELVKDLASVFKTRIELRQIGVRDETKILGGIGICGRPLCCHSYLSEFIPVSIKMAKEQNLSLNPTKISGVCGRLMCCLKNEEETYEYLNSRLPAQGDFVMHKGEGTKGTVHSVNVLRQTVKVVISLDGDDLEVREYPIDELTYRPRRKKSQGGKMTEEELRELEALEKQDLDEQTKEYSVEQESPRREDRSQGKGNPERGERRERRERNNRGRGERNVSDGAAEAEDSANRGERKNNKERSRRQDREKNAKQHENMKQSENSRQGENARQGENFRQGENTRQGENPRQGENSRQGENTRQGENPRQGENSRQGENPRQSENSRQGESHGERSRGERRSGRNHSSAEGNEEKTSEMTNPKERSNRRRRDRFRKGNGETRKSGDGDSAAHE